MDYQHGFLSQTRTLTSRPVQGLLPTSAQSTSAVKSSGGTNIGGPIIGSWRLGSSVLFLWLLAAPLVAQESVAQESVSETPSETSEVSEYENLLEAAHTFAGAKLLADAGRLPEALAAYEHVLELDGSDPYAYLEAARFHSYLAKSVRSDRKQLVHLETATEYSETARELVPESNDVLYQFAQIHLRLVEQNHFPSLAVATGAFEELWKRGNEELNVLLSLGQLYLWQRQSDKAAEVLQAAANRQPNHRMVQLMLVEALVGGEDQEKIEEALIRLLELDPGATEYRLRLVDMLSEQRAHSRAVEVLRAAPEEDQLHPQLRQTLAQELHLNGDNQDALVLTDSLLAEFTPVPDGLRRLRVAILSSLARYEEAIDELVVLIPKETEPKDISRQTVLLSRLLERVGRIDEAAQHLRDLIAQREGREQLQLKLGLLALLERQEVVDEAVALAQEEFDRAVATGESVMAFGRLLSNLFARMERFEEAEAVIEQIRGTLGEEAQEEVSQLNLQRLAILIEGEKWEEVVAASPEVEASESSEIREAGQILKAEALAQLGRIDEALESLAGEGSDGLFIKRLQILSENGEEETVHRELKKRVESGATEDLFFAAQTYQSLGLHQEAIPLLEQVLAKGGESVNVFFSLGAAQERSGAHAEAESAFRRLLEMAPDYAPALNYLGYMWADRGENLNEALRMLHRAVALDPDNGAYVDSLGWVYFQLGQYQEARLHMEWAVRLVPDDPTIFEHLGDIYLHLEQREQALESYRQALDLGADEEEKLRNKLRSLEGKGL